MVWKKRGRRTYKAPVVYTILGSDKLPAELLGRIFVLASKAERDNSHKNAILQERRDLCVTLSKVSRLWHSVVISTPGLWSMITIDATTPLAKTDKWLSRSGSIGLEVMIGVRDRRGFPSEKLGSISLRLCDHALRLQSFECHVTTQDEAKTITSFLQKRSLPLLEKFELRTGTRTSGTTLDLFSDDVNLPRLAEICLWSTPVTLRSIPSTNLVKVELVCLRNFDLVQLQEFLGWSFHLEELSIHGDLKEAANPASQHVAKPPDVKLLPRLKRLELAEFVNPIGLVQLVKTLKLPVLRQLVLRDILDNFETEESDQSIFLATLAEMSSSLGLAASLEGLQLLNVQFSSSAGWDALLRSLCRLRELRIAHIADAFEGHLGADSLLAKYFGSMVTPRLRQTLERERASDWEAAACPSLNEIKTFGIDYNALFWFAEDRKRAGLSLDKIVAHTKYGISKPNIRRFEALGVKAENYEDSVYEYPDEEQSRGYSSGWSS